MKSLIEYFNRYPIWANVLMFVILIYGYMSLKQINTSFFPENKSNLILVDMIYPGTSPTEIEQVLVKKIENNLVGMKGIDWTTSVSAENRGTIRVYVQESYDATEILIDVKNAVDRISGYPTGAEKPQVYVVPARSRSISVGLMASTDLWSLKDRAERFEEMLRTKPGVTQITVEGIPQRELAIELDQNALRARNVSQDDVVRAISGSNRDFSGGSVKTSAEELLIRSYNETNAVWKLQDLIVKSQGVSQVRLSDVAHVVERWADVPSATYFNGQRAVLISVDKTGGEDLLHIKDMTVEVLDEFRDLYPEIEAKILIDATDHLQGRIDLLTKNGMIGFILVTLILSLFLNWRIAFWVALGIPISFAGMFIIANILGITINVLSLFGMILVIGILVDDAIVVAEQIFQEKEKGATSFEAATKGIQQIIAPVFTAVLTTILAFTPFFFLEGYIGKLVPQMAVVVIGALIFSLVESFFILPAHLSHSKGLHKHDKDSVFRKKMESGFSAVVNKYGQSLAWVMKSKYVIVTIPIAFFIINKGMIDGKIIEFNPFPKMDRESVAIQLSMVPGTPLDKTNAIMEDLERKIWALNDEFKEHVVVGDSMFVAVKRSLGSNRKGEKGSHAADLKVSFAKAQNRTMGSTIIIKKMRQIFEDYPGVVSLSIEAGRWGRPVTFGLVSENLEALGKARDSLMSRLNEYSELKDIGDSEVRGRREIYIQTKDIANSYGLTSGEISRQVRNAWFGSEIQRLQRGPDEIRLWVRLKENERSSINQLSEFLIRTSKGDLVPLGVLADFEIKRGFAVIQHLDGARKITVEADFADPNISSTTMNERLNAEVIPDILAAFPNVQTAKEGQSRENSKMVASLARAFPPALFAILVILILVFRSYLQAGLILMMIPLGVIGAFWGHLIHGQMVTQLSAFGIIALTGIVINDSIVFVDQININIRKKMPIRQALIEAGTSRFRPILLTTMTTVIGLWPLIMETSFQAQFLIPMAISVAYGLLLGSVLILYLVPVFFEILNDMRYVSAKLWWKLGDEEGQKPTRQSVEPAYREAIQDERGDN